MPYRLAIPHNLVRLAGLEPARDRSHWILSPRRLPIPPQPHTQDIILRIYSSCFLKIIAVYVFFLYIIHILYNNFFKKSNWRRRWALNPRTGFPA